MFNFHYFASHCGITLVVYSPECTAFAGKLIGHNTRLFNWYQRFCNHDTGFVTSIKDNAAFESVEKQTVEEHIHSGVKEVEIILQIVKEGDNTSKLTLRKIRYYKEYSNESLTS